MYVPVMYSPNNYNKIYFQDTNSVIFKSERKLKIMLVII